MLSSSRARVPVGACPAPDLKLVNRESQVLLLVTVIISTPARLLRVNSHPSHLITAGHSLRVCCNGQRDENTHTCQRNSADGTACSPSRSNRAPRCSHRRTGTCIGVGRQASV